MARANRAASAAARALARGGSLSQERIAELCEISVATVSRALAGSVPMRPEILAVIRTADGDALASKVADLADEARRNRIKGADGAAA